MSKFLDKLKFPALFSHLFRTEKSAGNFNLSKKLLTRQFFLFWFASSYQMYIFYQQKTSLKIFCYKEALSHIFINSRTFHIKKTASRWNHFYQSPIVQPITFFLESIKAFFVAVLFLLSFLAIVWMITGFFLRISRVWSCFFDKRILLA